MNIFAIIPARGGSKGIPRKNIRPLAGKPLIAWSIEAAVAAKSVDRVIVSTDDEEIAAIAREWAADGEAMVPWDIPQEAPLDAFLVSSGVQACVSGYSSTLFYAKYIYDLPAYTFAGRIVDEIPVDKQWPLRMTMEHIPDYRELLGEGGLGVRRSGLGASVLSGVRKRENMHGSVDDYGDDNGSREERVNRLP